MNCVKINISIIFILIEFQCYCVESAKILGIFAMPAHSHYTLGFQLMKGLANKGHQITFIGPYSKNVSIKNFKEICVTDVIAPVEEFKKHLFATQSKSYYENIKFLFHMGLTYTDSTLQNKDVQNILKSNETFDLVIVEHFFNEAFLGFVHHFKTPYIMLVPLPVSIWNNFIVSNPTPIAYSPHTLLQSTNPMNFWTRILNLIYSVIDRLIYHGSILPKHRKIFQKYFKPSKNIILDNILYNVSLMLSTSHISINNAVPLIPNIIEIGGHHVEPPKPLPTDLQQFLDSATEGVILFSMGSNLKSKDLNEDIRNAILKSFAKIKQKVLWKFELDNLPGLPSNVKIMKWLPQKDILGHPNIKVFITHGGLLSTIETVYFGVPIIGIPVFADQHNNIALAVRKGYAISIPLTELSKETFSEALNEILNNPKYRDNARHRSKILHDQPLKPLDQAIFWIEYVIRHNGALDLRSAGSMLTWYERNMLDIIIFLVLLLLIVLTIYIIIKKSFFIKNIKTMQVKNKNA